MLTGKQRSYLRKLGQDEEPLVFIGKNDLTETVVREMDNLLTARELVKAKIQDTSTLDAKETANQLAEMLARSTCRPSAADLCCTDRHRRKRIGRSCCRDK